MTNITLNKYKNVCRYYTIYIILFSALLTINIGLPLFLFTIDT